jgi:SAM-dependent methyltransferase
MKRKALPSYETLSRPLPIWHPKAWYYGTLKLLLHSVGQLSDGIRIGLRYGFDSGVMLEYVYRNQAHGISPVGKLIDRVYLDSEGWRGIRQRGELLKVILWKTLQVHLQQGAQTPCGLLDVACGGGRYDLEVLREFPPESIAATLRDYKPENVEKVRQLAAQLNVSAIVEQADAFSDRDLKRVHPQPNVIVVSGLHEILPDDQLIQHHFQQLFQILQAPGTLIFTIQPYHPQVELIARLLPSHTGDLWVMRLRSLVLVQQWAEAAGFQDLKVQMEPSGIFGVVTAQKRSEPNKNRVML